MKTGGSGHGYGEVEAYSHTVLANVTQGNNLYLQASGNFYLIGAQISVLNVPTYVVTSPGFIN